MLFSCVQECYEMYEMYEMYENATRMLFSYVQEPYKMYKMYEMYEMYKMYEMYEMYEMYKMYEMYENATRMLFSCVRKRYKIYKIYKEGMRKHRTDGRYPTPYLNQSLLWYFRPTMAWPCSAEALPVTPDAFGWLELQQNQLFRPPSYDFSWRAWTRVFHLCTIVTCCLLNDLYGCLLNQMPWQLVCLLTCVFADLYGR